MNPALSCLPRPFPSYSSALSPMTSFPVSSLAVARNPLPQTQPPAAPLRCHSRHLPKNSYCNVSAALHLFFRVSMS